jgi:hypothetical protein
MKSELIKSLETRKASKFIKFLLFSFAVLALIFFMLKISRFIYCHTIAFCHDFSASPEMIATQLAQQYEDAVQDIAATRYKSAQQRLEYIIYRNPEYPGAAEKLAEVEKILLVTPAP